MTRSPLLVAAAATAILATPAAFAQTPPPSTQPVPTLPVEPRDPVAPPVPDMSISPAPAPAQALPQTTTPTPAPTPSAGMPAAPAPPVAGSSAARPAPPGTTAPNGEPAATIVTVSSPPVPHPTDGQVDGQRRPR